MELSLPPHLGAPSVTTPPPPNSVCTLRAPQTVHACSGPFTLQTVLPTQGHPPPQTVHTRPEPPNHACTLRAPQTMHIHSRPPNGACTLRAPISCILIRASQTMHTLRAPQIVHAHSELPTRLLLGTCSCALRWARREEDVDPSWERIRGLKTWCLEVRVEEWGAQEVPGLENQGISTRQAWC